jgi:predicted NUDIX family NTP pyrophosphohydrolase
MARQSAGLLMYRMRGERLEVLLVHPGGPFWVRKDRGAWSVPKGEFGPGEEPLAAAQREFHEETGFTAVGPFAPLDPIKQSGGKIVHAWACAGDCDPDAIKSNAFSLEWPPRSGNVQEFPEIDRAAWFTVEEARDRIFKSQQPLLDQLKQRLGTAEETGGHL